jgi:Putative transposase DNA-binding domain
VFILSHSAVLPNAVVMLDSQGARHLSNALFLRDDNRNKVGDRTEIGYNYSSSAQSNDSPYKCDFAGATFAEVDEAFSTQTCSACDSCGGPKGIAGLGMRVWTCCACGTVHDRNVNAAKILLAAGRRRLAEGIPAPFRAREDVKNHHEFSHVVFLSFAVYR